MLRSNRFNQYESQGSFNKRTRRNSLRCPAIASPPLSPLILQTLEYHSLQNARLCFVSHHFAELVEARSSFARKDARPRHLFRGRKMPRYDWTHRSAHACMRFSAAGDALSLCLRPCHGPLCLRRCHCPLCLRPCHCRLRGPIRVKPSPLPGAGMRLAGLLSASCINFINLNHP